MSNGNGNVIHLPELVVRPPAEGTQGAATTPAAAPGGIVTAVGGDGSDVDSQSAQPTPQALSFAAPADVATLVVNGLEFNDWESVWIRADHTNAATEFRFTAVERDYPQGMLRQFGPGDQVTIYLGSSMVVNGFLEHRQVGYDAQRHGIELMGANVTAPVMRSSVDTNTGSFDGMSFLQVAQKVLAQYPVGIKTIGVLNALPFVKLQNQPGEQIWDFLERIARVRGIIIGNDSFHNFLAVGPFNGQALPQQLIEGQNIKRCNAIYHQRHSFKEIGTIGQRAGDNQTFGPAANEQQATVPGPGYFPSKIIVPAEQPVWGVAELQDRARWESLWQRSDEVTVFATVYGWYRSPGRLWWPYDSVFVNSPMIPMQSAMTIKSVQFKQDNSSGTETEIELRMPWGMNGNIPVGKITPPGVQDQ